MFGWSDKEKRVLMYLYENKDLTANPPHQDLSIRRIAERLGLRQREVREAMKKLSKGFYANYSTYEGVGYCSITPRGKKEIEKETTTDSEFRIGTDGLSYGQFRIGTDGLSYGQFRIGTDGLSYGRKKTEEK
jgi:DNA-binding Lrp family transcriptional regulator